MTLMTRQLAGADFRAAPPPLQLAKANPVFLTLVAPFRDFA
jgi:hypothetical protein